MGCGDCMQLDAGLNEGTRSGRRLLSSVVVPIAGIMSGGCILVRFPAQSVSSNAVWRASEQYTVLTTNSLCKRDSLDALISERRFSVSERNEWDGCRQPQVKEKKYWSFAPRKAGLLANRFRLLLWTMVYSLAANAVVLYNVPLFVSCHALLSFRVTIKEKKATPVSGS